MSNSIPSGALGLSIAVIVYTTICLIAGLLLFYLLWTQERRYSYVLILSVLVSIATTASLIQQLHYVFDWRTVKAGEYAMSSQLSTNAGAAISNGAHGLDLGLFWIQFYTYNANSLLILFWAMMLFCGTWRFYPKLSFIGPLRNHMETCSKVFAILFPILLLSIAQAKPIASQEFVFAIFCNVNLVASCSAGAVLICLTLFKFIQARRSLNGSTFSSHGVSQGATVQGTVTDGAPSGNQAKRNQRAIDRAIIIRFTVAFTILSIFEGADILFQVLSFQNAQINTSSGAPKTADFTTSGAITDIVTFIPGVTCSLIAWAIWGTTRKYLDETKRLLRSIFCCCCNNRGRRSTSRQGGRGNIYELRDTVVAGGQQKQQFRRLSSGKDGMSDDKRMSVRGNDIRVLTELTVLESISDEELDIGGKDSGGFVGRNGSRHHTTVTTSAV